MTNPGFASLTSRAVRTHAGGGLDDVDPRVAVAQLEELPDVDVETMGEHRQLIGEGDVDVAVCILGQLRHLRRPRIGHQELALAEQLVEITCALTRFTVESADDAIVRAQLDHDPSGSTRSGQWAK